MSPRPSRRDYHNCRPSSASLSTRLHRKWRHLRRRIDSDPAALPEMLSRERAAPSDPIVDMPGSHAVLPCRSRHLAQLAAAPPPLHRKRPTFDLTDCS